MMMMKIKRDRVNSKYIKLKDGEWSLGIGKYGGFRKPETQYFKLRDDEYSLGMGKYESLKEAETQTWLSF